MSKFRTALLGILFALILAPVTHASSDVGYTIHRGAFSVTVRYSMFIDESSKDDEPYRLDKTFYELAQWVWDNRSTLEKRKGGFSYDVGDLAENGGGKVGREIGASWMTLPFKKGELAKTIIGDLSRRLNIKAPARQHGPAKVLAVSSIDKYPVPLGQPKSWQGDIFIGAFPSSPCYRVTDIAKALGSKLLNADCGYFFWGDRKFEKSPDIEILEFQLTPDFIRKNMRDAL